MGLGIAITLITLAITAWGCSSSENKPADGDLDHRTDSPFDADPPVDGDPDDEVTGGDLDEDEEIADAEDDFDATEREDEQALRPETPMSPTATFVGQAPCAFPASLSYDAAGDRLMATCSGAPSALFRSTPLTDGAPNWSEVGYADGYPSNHIRLSDRYHLIAHASPDGITVVDAESGAATTAINFASLPIVSTLGFAPNNPNGAILAGEQIFIATSNIDTADYTDPALTTYFSGTVLACPYEGDGIVDGQACTAFETEAKNPTSMALLANGSLAVLEANTYDLDSGNSAALELFTLPNLSRQIIDLGNITGQVAPTMALLDNGALCFARQRPDNALMIVDSEGIAADHELPQVENFISSVQTDGAVAAVADFGVFGEGGRVLFLDTRANGWEGVPITELTGAAGPAIMAGDTLYIAVTANDAMSASIVSIDMTELH